MNTEESKETTQSFNIVTHQAEEELTRAGYKVRFHTGQWHITAPWTWHRLGDGWQLMLPGGLHFYEEYGTLYHD